MSEPKAKAKLYRITKGRGGLSIVGFPFTITEAMLNDPKDGDKDVSMMERQEKDNCVLIFISPAIDTETRSAKAIIELDNADGGWRPGEFANAAIATSAQETDLIIPKEAVQTIEGKPAVFVRTGKGFEKRDVTIGREDSRHVEIISGVELGEPIAVSNTFTLKAELGKSEAEHAH